MICAGAVSSCKDKNTTAPDLGFLQINPRTVEVVIPFDDFVDDVQVFGGYGSTGALGYGAVARDFGGLTSRTLVHFDDFPTTADVAGSLSFLGGRVMLVFDTVNGTLDTPSNVELYDVVEDWHATTVTWDVAVDTAGDRRLWTQPGGGPTTLLGGAIFDAFLAQQANDSLARLDTVSIAIDSATVASLGDPGGATGLLLAAAEPGVHLRLRDMVLLLTTRASSRTDTSFVMSVPADDVSSIFDPVPAAPAGWLRVGGAPSWRSVITVSIPATVDGTVELCGMVGCEVDLTEVDLNLAELVLTTRQSEAAFQPQDTSRLDVRRVLNTDLLPKSPLSPPLMPFVQSVPPEFFSVQAGTTVALSLTGFVSEILSAAAETGTVSTASLSLLSAFEPLMIGFASFEGGGGAGAPALRLLYTVANGVGLP
jgi:hypothetical protein